tara:strand:+ start:628 stop:1149 length:522 start_codon:yes stop_codon:yes gene_type:complete
VIKVHGQPVTTNQKHLIYGSKIDDEEMNHQIVSVIDEMGDVQKNTTNVKAQMTDWKMADKPGFIKLSYYFREIVKEISLNDHKRVYGMRIKDMWGMKYKSGDYAITHDHWPALWSMSYYINPPENGPNIVFPNSKYQVKPMNGLMVIFPAYVKHEVEKKEFEGYRYVVSANGY